MPVQYKYRGRVITQQDITFLRQFIADHSHLSRRRLSAKVCEAWDWKQTNGALRDMVCRGLLLMLHRAGEIELPQVRFVARNPLVERERPAPVLIDTTPLIAHLRELRRWRCSRSAAPGMSHCSTALSSITTISATSSRWASI